MLRCKQGDLAVVVRSGLGNIGKIVRCLHIASPEELSAAFGKISGHGPIWRVNAPLKWAYWVCGQVELPFSADEAMRPLRDSEGEDEILRLVGKPADSLVGA